MTVSICGNKYEIEASLAASTIYTNEFYGKLDEPYKGYLMDDILTLFHESETNTNAVTAFGDQALYRIVWAMARACGSIKDTYKKFYSNKIEHGSFNMYEYSGLFTDVIFNLCQRTFFRLPEGQGDVGEPDNTEAEQGTNS